MKMKMMVIRKLVIMKIMKLLMSWQERRLKVIRKVALQVKMVTVKALRKRHLVVSLNVNQCCDLKVFD
jgi:hypothetical protein